VDPWINAILSGKQAEQLTIAQRNAVTHSAGKCWIINGNHRFVACACTGTPATQGKTKWNALIYKHDMPFDLAMKMAGLMTHAEQDTAQKATLVEEFLELDAVRDFLVANEKTTSCPALRAAAALHYPTQPCENTVRCFVMMVKQTNIENNVSPGLLDLMSCIDAIDLSLIRSACGLRPKKDAPKASGFRQQPLWKGLEAAVKFEGRTFMLQCKAMAVQFVHFVVEGEPAATKVVVHAVEHCSKLCKIDLDLIVVYKCKIRLKNQRNDFVGHHGGGYGVGLLSRRC
jgi:hypothetical protein